MEPSPEANRLEHAHSRSLLLMPRWRVAAIWFAVAVLIGSGATGFLFCVSLTCVVIGSHYLLPCAWLRPFHNSVWSCERWYSGIQRHTLSEFREVILKREWLDQLVTYRVVLHGPESQFDVFSDSPRYDRSLRYAREISQVLGCELRDEHQLLGETWSLDELREHSLAEGNAAEGSVEQVNPRLTADTLELLRRSNWSWAILPLLLLKGGRVFFRWRIWQRPGLLSLSIATLAGISGIGWLLGRSGVVCDRRRQRVWRWRAFRWMPVGWQLSFDRIQRVTITPRSIRNPVNYYAPALRFVVGLEGPDAAFTVGEIEDLFDAWDDASDLACFLNRELVDFTSQAADLTVIDSRLKKPDANWTMPPLPAGSRLQISRSATDHSGEGAASGTLIVTVPPPRWPGLWMLWLAGFFFPVFSIAFCVMVHEDVFGQDFRRNFHDVIDLLTGLLMVVWLLGLLAVLIPTLRVLRRKETLQLSPEQIILDRQSLFDVKCHTELPTRRVRQIEITTPQSKDLIMDMNGAFSPRRVLRIEGREEYLEIGGSLSDLERQWIRELMIAVIASARYTRDS